MSETLTASPTAGMNLGERIAHVGGHENAAGYIEFGSVMAVDALIRHALRDKETTDASKFKNFHRLLCERFGYVHDDRDWRRDQLSLIEWIAAMMPKPRFPETFCSSCGKALGPGDAGVSHCGDHR